MIVIKLLNRKESESLLSSNLWEIRGNASLSQLPTRTQIQEAPNGQDGLRNDCGRRLQELVRLTDVMLIG